MNDEFNSGEREGLRQAGRGVVYPVLRGQSEGRRGESGGRGDA